MLNPVLTLALIAASLLPIQEIPPGTPEHPQEETPISFDVPDGTLFLGATRKSETNDGTTRLVAEVRMVSIVDKNIIRPRDIDIDLVSSIFPDPKTVTVTSIPDSPGVILVTGGDFDFDKLRDLAKPQLEVIAGGKSGEPKKPKATKAPKSSPAATPPATATTPTSTSPSMAAVKPVPKPSNKKKS